MSLRRLTPSDAARYRALTLEADEAHPDAFTSSVSKRAVLPLFGWSAKVADAVTPTEGRYFERDREREAWDWLREGAEAGRS